MVRVQLTADAFACVLLVVLLYANQFETKHKTLRDKIFTWFTSANLILTAMDTLTWVLDFRADYIRINYITSSLTIALAFPAIYLFALYVQATVEKYHRIVKWHKIVLSGYTVIATVLSIYLISTGRVFTLRRAHYETGDVYWLYMMLVFFMYAYILILATVNFKSISKQEKTAFVSYSLAPFLALILEIFVENLSLSYPATAVSILLIYIMLQSEHQENAYKKETILIETSKTDDMTGLRNRRAYNEILEQVPDSENIGVVFSDINGLKYFNDTYGHNAGDRLVIKMAQLLQENFRRDEIYRISGDEFVVICQGIPEEELSKRVQKLSSRNEGDEYQIAAFGSAWGTGKELDKLIRSAEEMMYVQKTIFHRQFPKYVRKGGLFIRNLVDDGNETESRRKLEEAPVANKNNEKHTVLLSENTEQHEMLVTLLSSTYNIVECESDRKALDTLEKRGDIALVLMDAQSKGINCEDFLQIQQSEPAIMGIPVIVTGDNREGNSEARFLRLGAFDFISRPCSAETLLNRIQRTIEMKESAATLRAIERDELTGLYSKQVFAHHLERMLERDRYARYDLAMFDVQNFKLVNERHGEGAADSVLKSIGNYLNSIQNVNTISGRYGGDVFLCLMDVTASGDAGIWEKMVIDMEQSSPIKGIVIKCGIYENVDHNLAAATLCDRTMLALRTVKHQYGRPCARFDEQLQLKIRREQQMELTMTEAYRQDQFKVFYQPKCDARTGKLIGAEALLRWEHPIYGFLPPDEFIPLFERNGFISNVDYYVWNRTGKNLRKWMDMGLKVVPVSVNASKRDFVHNGHIDTTEKVMEKYNISPSLLHIEVTESLFADSEDALIRELMKYRKRGHMIELDDFGSGFSSLNSLGSLPIDIVKFDKTFVEELYDERKRKVLSSCITLAKSIGFNVLVEGVETREQRDAIAEMGADSIQGYYYSRPLSEEAFEEYMKRESKSEK